MSALGLGVKVAVLLILGFFMQFFIRDVYGAGALAAILAVRKQKDFYNLI